MHNTPKILLWLGIILILIVGLIHVVDAKDSFNDAIYKGWLFYANGLGALIAAYGIYRKDNWGWNLGLLIATGSFFAYIASRTIGLPYIPAEPDAWFEPLGISAMMSEGLFIAVFFVKQAKYFQARE